MRGKSEDEGVMSGWKSEKVRGRMIRGDGALLRRKVVLLECTID